MWNPSNFGSVKSGDLGGTPTPQPGSRSQVTSAGSVISERSEAEVETWMILEYCDKGSLQVRLLTNFRVYETCVDSRLSGGGDVDGPRVLRQVFAAVAVL